MPATSDGKSNPVIEVKNKPSRSDLLQEMLTHAERIVRSRYGDSNGNIHPTNAKIMADDLTALTVAHLSNYIPAVMPELREEAKRLVVRILDLELEYK